MESNKEIYKENSKKTFDYQAEIYDQTYYGKHAGNLYDVIVQKIEKLNPNSLLDVGCGTGNILSILCKSDKINLFGIDLSEVMIVEAKKKTNSKVELKVGDSEQLPWRDGNFECIICTDSFHHYPRPEKVLLEMARVLKLNGKIIIGDPWALDPLRQIINIFCKFSKAGDYRIYSKKEIKELLLKCGFKNIVWEKVNRNSFVITGEVNK